MAASVTPPLPSLGYRLLRIDNGCCAAQCRQAADRGGDQRRVRRQLWDSPFGRAEGGRGRIAAKADHSYAITDIAAPIASGSFKTQAMIVAPCSVRTMSEIATGVTTNLLTRAADVALKERRPLILLVRESPLHLGHLRTLTQLAEIGAIILPPVPAFYAEPQSIPDLVDQMVGRMLDLLGYTWPMRRWGEDLAKGRRRRKGGA